jgi:Phage protein Gp138 N-terminal domain/GpV Apex motif
MDQRERYLDEAEVVRLALSNWQTRLWTALPGVIKQFPSASGIGQMVADIQPTINGRVLTTTGVFQSIQMPVLLDCPILWQGGGGMTLTFPIQAGDECLVIFSSRCIDAWWQQGFIAGQAGVPVDGKQAMDPPDLRMHNLSDGFAIVGVRSLPTSYTPDSSNASLQSDDGLFFFKMNPTTKAASLTASGGITLNGVTIDSSGNLTSPATIKGKTDVTTDSISLNNHVHTGVSTGSSDTGPPTG